jgi:hypothetical protein
MAKNKDSADRDVELNGREESVRLLHGLITELDEEGIQFLIHQAQVLQYNKQVREINKRIAEKKPRDPQEKKTGGNTNPMRTARHPAVEIVERGDGKHFFIVIRGFRIYFTLEEMKKLVRICHVAQDAADASKHLYNWFKRFRSDFLVDGDIGGAANPYLVDLYRKLISTYKVGEDG